MNGQLEFSFGALDVDGIPVNVGDIVCYMGGRPFTVERAAGGMLYHGNDEIQAALCHRPDGRSGREVWAKYMEGAE